MNSDELWKPTQQQEPYPEETITKTQTPRRAFTSLQDVLQEDQRSGPAKHSSYHVPPGNDIFISIEIVYYYAVGTSVEMFVR